MPYTKIQSQCFISSEEEDFYVFLLLFFFIIVVFTIYEHGSLFNGVEAFEQTVNIPLTEGTM